MPCETSSRDGVSECASRSAKLEGKIAVDHVNIPVRAVSQVQSYTCQHSSRDISPVADQRRQRRRP